MPDRPHAVRLTVPVAVGTLTDEVVLEPGHLERLFQAALFAAMRDGLLAPGEEAVARLLPGAVRATHGPVLCLAGCRVELARASGLVVAGVDFGLEAFAAFALARAVHLAVEARVEIQGAVTFSLHAAVTGDEACALTVPALPSRSVDALVATAEAMGSPSLDWIVTFVTPAVSAGLEALSAASRASGVEAAGRIHTLTAFDPERRAFVRVLDRLVVAHTREATAVTVRPSAASWGAFLAGRSATAPSVASSVHTHVHLREDAPGEGPSGEELLGGDDGLARRDDVCISIHDIVTHYVTFPDPLSAAAIISVFPDERVDTLYGYSPRALLRREPGWFSLRADAAGAIEESSHA
jgi:hypothetical protein